MRTRVVRACALGPCLERGWCDCAVRSAYREGCFSLCVSTCLCTSLSVSTCLCICVRLRSDLTPGSLSEQAHVFVLLARQLSAVCVPPVLRHVHAQTLHFCLLQRHESERARGTGRFWSKLRRAVDHLQSPGKGMSYFSRRRAHSYLMRAVEQIFPRTCRGASQRTPCSAE